MPLVFEKWQVSCLRKYPLSFLQSSHLIVHLQVQLCRCQHLLESDGVVEVDYSLLFKHRRIKPRGFQQTNWADWLWSKALREVLAHPPGWEVVGLEAPLLAVGSVILQVLPHDRVLGFKEDVAVRAGRRTAAVVHCSWREKKQADIARMSVGYHSASGKNILILLQLYTYTYSRRTVGSGT